MKFRTSHINAGGYNAKTGNKPIGRGVKTHDLDASARAALWNFSARIEPNFKVFFSCRNYRLPIGLAKAWPSGNSELLFSSELNNGSSH